METTVSEILPQSIPTAAEDVVYAYQGKDTLNKTTDISPCVKWLPQTNLGVSQQEKYKTPRYKNNHV